MSALIFYYYSGLVIIALFDLESEIRVCSRLTISKETRAREGITVK